MSKYTVFHCFSCRLSLIRLLSNFHITCKSEIQHSDIRQSETQEPCGIWWAQPHDAKSGTIGDILVDATGCTSYFLTFLTHQIWAVPSCLVLEDCQATMWHCTNVVGTLQHTSVVVPNKLSKLCLLCFHLAGDTGLKPSQAPTLRPGRLLYTAFYSHVLNPIFAKNWHGLKWDVSGKVTSGQSTKAHLCICILKRDWIALSSCPASWIPKMMHVNSHWPKKLCMPIAW